MRRWIGGYVRGNRALTTYTVLSCALLCACSSKPDQTQPPLGDNVEVIRPLQLTENARVPERDPALTGVEVAADSLVFNYNAAPSIKLEVDHVVAGAMGGGYLRRIVKVGGSEQRVEVQTKPAQLTDFILDGAFRVRQVGKTWDEGTGIGKRLFGLDSESKLQIFGRGETSGGILCGPAGSASVTVKPVFDLTLDFDVLIDIRFEGYFPPTPTLYEARFVASGAVTAGVDIDFDAELSISCVIDVIKLLRERRNDDDLFKYNLRPLTFYIGWVPVVITHAIEPTFSFEVGGSANVKNNTYSKRTTYGIEVGAAYDRSRGWYGIWEPTRSATASVKPGALNGSTKISLSAGVSAGVQYSALVYDVAGPKIGLEGALTGKVSLIDKPECKKQVTVDAALNAIVGAEVQVPVIDLKLLDYTQKFTLAKKVLYDQTSELPGCKDTTPDAGPDLGDPDVSVPDKGVDAGPPTPDTQPPTPDTQPPTPDTQPPTPDTKPPAPDGGTCPPAEPSQLVRRHQAGPGLRGDVRQAVFEQPFVCHRRRLQQPVPAALLRRRQPHRAHRLSGRLLHLRRDDQVPERNLLG